MAEAKLTIRQIAELAGVSRSTVSRVLNRHPNVSAETRERVSRVVSDTGFLPNPVARSLSSSRVGIIGLVIPLAIQSLFEDPFYPRLMQGITKGCNSHDFTLSLFLFHTLDEEAKLYPRIAHSRLLDGVIVTENDTGDPLIPELLAHQVPCVLYGRHDDPRVSYVQVDDAAGGYMAVSHLVRLGRRRIAHITGPAHSLAAEDRKRGYLDALQERRVPVDGALIREGDLTEAGGYEAMRCLLGQAPDAVFAASDSMAVGALHALRAAGKRVPQEVAVVGFGGMPQAASTDPPLTTVRQPTQRAGVLAVEMLLDILSNGAEPARRIVLPTELVVRTSCGSLLAN